VASSSRSSFYGDSTGSEYNLPQTFSPPQSYYEPPPRSYQAQTYPGLGISAISPGSIDIPRFTPRAREFRQTSPPQASPPRTEFHSRLYPGSVRHAARAASLSRPSPPTEAAFGRGPGGGYGFGGSEYGVTIGSRRQHQFAFGNGSAGAATNPNLSFGRSRGSASVTSEVNWQELMGDADIHRDFGTSGSRATLFSETLSTPRAESPRFAHQEIIPAEDKLSALENSGGLQKLNVPASPSLATVSSPASSALGHSPGSMRQDVSVNLLLDNLSILKLFTCQPDTRPTTASSTRRPSLNELTYTITPSR